MSCERLDNSFHNNVNSVRHVWIHKTNTIQQLIGPFTNAYVPTLCLQNVMYFVIRLRPISIVLFL
jgi:hypothetical protein